jgi:hypothetical protein
MSAARALAIRNKPQVFTADLCFNIHGEKHLECLGWITDDEQSSTVLCVCGCHKVLLPQSSSFCGQAN